MCEAHLSLIYFIKIMIYRVLQKGNIVKSRLFLKVTEDREKILDGVSDVLNIAESHGLKVMLLLKPPFEKEIENFTIEMLKRFSDNPTIFAYDFMNEPLYFDIEPNRTKTDAVKIVSKWKDMMKEYAPNHLLTIGFSEPIEVFEWDPSMLLLKKEKKKLLFPFSLRVQLSATKKMVLNIT